MSTRATYRFVDDGRDVTFYIHHDGYPSGAAAYFQAMIDNEGSMESCNHGLAEVFFRANERAEFTKGHDWHGDTEYRYTVGSASGSYRFNERAAMNRRLRAERSTHGETWERFFEGPVEEFIEKYARSYA